MSTDPTEPLRTTVRFPADCRGINMTPVFGGGYLIRFVGPGGGFLGDAITAPASVTFNPDGTLTYPVPLGHPADA